MSRGADWPCPPPRPLEFGKQKKRSLQGNLGHISYIFK